MKAGQNIRIRADFWNLSLNINAKQLWKVLNVISKIFIKGKNIFVFYCVTKTKPETLGCYKVGLLYGILLNLIIFQVNKLYGIPDVAPFWADHDIVVRLIPESYLQI